jgi:hypothetical protein
MHLSHEVTHLGQSGAWWLDDNFDAISDGVEVLIGGKDRYLNEGIGREIKTSHLAIYPDQRHALIHSLNLPSRGPI